MVGFALSQDGSKVYLGGAEHRPLSSRRAPTSSSQQVSSIHVQCLATHGADLWACSDEPSGFIAGVSQDDGTTLHPEAPPDDDRRPRILPAEHDVGPDLHDDRLRRRGPLQPVRLALHQLRRLLRRGGARPAAHPRLRRGRSVRPVRERQQQRWRERRQQQRRERGGGDGGTPPCRGQVGRCGCSVVGGGGAAGALFGLGLAAIAARRRRSR